MMIKITFPDNSVKEFESGITPLQIAESISPRLAQEVLAATVDGQEWDLSRSINADAAVKLFKWDDPEGKHAFWHSSAHLLAEALQELYPGIKFGIGPAIENGFYYDVDPGEATITAADFPTIANWRAVKNRLFGKKYRRPMLSTDSVNVEKNIKLNLSANSKTVR